MNRRYLKIVLGSAIYVLIANCSSQIDSIPNPVISSQTVNAGGVYLGTISSANTPVTAIFDSTEHFVIYSNDGSTLHAGIYSLVNAGISGQAKIFTLGSSAAPDVETLNGTFQPQSAISMGYILQSNGGSGQINLNSYQAMIYEQPSATKLLTGTWGVEDNFGQPTSQFTISGDGTFSGMTTVPNCSYYNGQFSTINLQYNAYKVSVTESCTVNNVNTIQSLTGLASIYPANTQTGSPQQLVIGITSTSEGRLFLLTPNS